MKKVLYLMRHGETQLNVEKRNQGWYDAPLTKKGIRQAEIAGEYFKKNGICFDHAYSSTSERACDTLEIVTDHKMPYTRCKGLKELNFGAYEGKDNFLNPPLPFKDFFKGYGGESIDELVERVNDTLLNIMNQKDHNSVLVVSHGAACANFLLNWQFCSTYKYSGRGIKNCTIFKYEFENEQFDLVDIIVHDFDNSDTK